MTRGDPEPAASDRIPQTTYCRGRLRNLPVAGFLLRWGKGNGVRQLGQLFKLTASHEHSRRLPFILFCFLPNLTRVKFGSACPRAYGIHTSLLRGLVFADSLVGKGWRDAGVIGVFWGFTPGKRGADLRARLASHGGQGVRVRRLGGSRAGEMRITRFLRNPSVTVEEMIGTGFARTAATCQGRPVRGGIFWRSRIPRSRGRMAAAAAAVSCMR